MRWRKISGIVIQRNEKENSGNVWRNDERWCCLFCLSFRWHGMFILCVGYVENNEPSKAIDLFHEIENPNGVIRTLVLNACAQLQSAAALTLVKRISSHLSEADISNPYLVTSLLDALIKCGDIKSAESVFMTTKKKSLEMYGTMMSGNLP